VQPLDVYRLTQQPFQGLLLKREWLLFSGQELKLSLCRLCASIRRRLCLSQIKSGHMGDAVPAKIERQRICPMRSTAREPGASDRILLINRHILPK
jgi:hypothetical protein